MMATTSKTGRPSARSPEIETAVWAAFGLICGVGARQGMHEGGQHRGHEVGLLQSGHPDRVADLLMVGPSLGVLAGHIQPVRKGVGPDPGNRFLLREQLQAGQVVLGRLPGDDQQLTQQPGADPAGCLHPGLVQPVKGRHQLLEASRLAGRVGWGGAVPASGEQVDVVAQQMQRDILDRPARAYRGRPPLPGGKRGEQLEQRRPLGREQVSDDDDLRVHADHCAALVACRSAGEGLVRSATMDREVADR